MSSVSYVQKGYFYLNNIRFEKESHFYCLFELDFAELEDFFAFVDLDKLSVVAVVVVIDADVVVTAADFVDFVFFDAAAVDNSVDSAEFVVFENLLAIFSKVLAYVEFSRTEQG